MPVWSDFFLIRTGFLLDTVSDFVDFVQTLNFRPHLPMKYCLLLIFSLCLSANTFAQGHRYLCNGCDRSVQPRQTNRNADQTTPTLPGVKVFPNPATEYIQLANADEAAHIVLYNLVGRRVRRFAVEQNGKYFVGDLATGMYLVQVLDAHQRPVATLRLSKK